MNCIREDEKLIISGWITCKYYSKSYSNGKSDSRPHRDPDCERYCLSYRDRLVSSQLRTDFVCFAQPYITQETHAQVRGIVVFASPAAWQQFVCKLIMAGSVGVNVPSIHCLV